MNDGHVVLDTTSMVYDRVFAYYEGVCQEDKEARILRARHESAAINDVQNRKFDGDKRVDMIRHYLEYGFADARGKTIVRSKEQRQIHETYIRCCLPKIYQGEWDDNQERILKRFGISRLQQEACVVMPRRSGKTWSMAMFCAVMLIVCSDVEVSVFATVLRTAVKLGKLIYKMLQSLFEYMGNDEYKIIHQNKETVTIIGPDGTERICGCYPGSATVKIQFVFLDYFFYFFVCVCNGQSTLKGKSILFSAVIWSKECNLYYDQWTNLLLHVLLRNKKLFYIHYIYQLHLIYILQTYIGCLSFFLDYRM